MNREELLGIDGTTFIDGLTNDVDDTAKDFLTDGNGDGSTSVDDLLAADETCEKGRRLILVCTVSQITKSRMV